MTLERDSSVVISSTLETPTDVVLTGFTGNKLDVIKAVQSITGLGLKEAKELVESAPVVISGSGLNSDEIQRLLEVAGGEVRLESGKPTLVNLLPDYELIFNQGNGVAFDQALQIELGLNGLVDELSALLASGDFFLGLEVVDSQGSGLYVLNSGLTQAVSEPASWSLLLLAVGLLLSRRGIR